MHKPKTFSAEAPEVQKREEFVTRLRDIAQIHTTTGNYHTADLLWAAADEIRRLSTPPKKLLTAESVTIEIVAVGPVASGKTEALARAIRRMTPEVGDSDIALSHELLWEEDSELFRRALYPRGIDTSNVSLRAEVRHNDHAEVPA